MKEFFDNYVNIFTSFGYIAVVIGLIFTSIQIALTKKQIKANRSYKIRKDSMEILKSIEDNEVFEYIRASVPKKISKQKESLAKRKIQELLQFYSALHRQWKLGYIDREDWEDILNNFGKFLSYYFVREYWNEKVKKDTTTWRDDFKELGEQFI